MSARRRPLAGDVRVSKDKVRSFLNTFVEEYQKITKTDLPEHYERFPLWEFPVRIIGGITPSRVYIYVTRDKNPVETVVEVYDESNFPKLGKVMDALEEKIDVITSILEIDSGIFSYVKDAQEAQFSEDAARSVARMLVTQHYQLLSNDKEIAVTKYSNQPLPSYSPPLKFLRTSLAVNEIKEHIERMLTEAESEILISGWLDTTFLGILQEKKEKGIGIRILTKKPDERSPVTVKTAYEQIVKIGDVRRNKLLHFRLVLRDKKELFISSSDLTNSSLTHNFEAGIWTTSPQAISNAVDFFEKVWEDNGSKNVNEEFARSKKPERKGRA